MTEFTPFPKIRNIFNLHITITQKIHGSNAQLVINEDGTILTGSRNRWVVPGDDNFGFSTWCHANKASLVDSLGHGTHFGEWAGPGINSGEGLTEKTFCLFEPRVYSTRTLPPNVVVVPVLYEGPLDLQAVENIMEDLREGGSKLVPGFMRPEGIVIDLLGIKLKRVFTPEETAWTKSGDKKSPKTPTVDYNYLLQPLRLEKLLSKDERYTRNFPESLVEIVKAYLQDLTDEGQIAGDATHVQLTRKAISSTVFKFVKDYMSGSSL